MAQYDISEIVDPKALAALDKLDQQTQKVLVNIVSIHKEASQMNNALKKVTGDNIKKIETTSKRAATTNNKLAKSTFKLNNLNSQYMKTLQSLAKQKERETKKTAEQIKQEKDLAIVNSKSAGTLEKLAAKNRILRREREKLNLDTEKGRKRLDELNKAIDKNNERIKESSDRLKKQKIGIGGYQDAIENSIPALRGMSNGLRGVGAQMKALLANPIILFLAAIVGAFTALRAALKRSEKGQDSLNKITSVFSAILGKLADIVTTIAEKLVDAFTNPKKAISDLWATLKQNFINRLVSFKKLMVAIGGVIEGVFHLDPEKIKENAKKAGNAFIDMNTGVIDTLSKTKKAVKDYGKEMETSMKLGADYADKEAEYNRVSRRYLIENAKNHMASAEALRKAEVMKRSDTEKSIELYNKAFTIEEKTLSNELDLAKRRLVMLREKAAIAKNDKEMNDKLAQAEADLYDKQAAFDEKRRQKEMMLNRIKMEAVKQAREAALGQYQVAKEEFEKEKQLNDDILKDTRVNLEEKLKLLAEEWQQEEELNKKKFTADKAQYDEQLKLGLVSQETYNKVIEGLKAQQRAADRKAQKEHEDEVEKITIAAIKQRGDKETEALNDIERKKLIELKRALAQGLITEEDYQNRKNDIIYAGNQEEIKIKMASIKKEIDAIKGNTEEKLALQQQYNELSGQLDDARLQHAIDNREKEKAKIESVLEAVGQLETGIFNLQKALSDRKLAKLEEEKNKELAAAGDNAAKKKKINEKFAKEEAKIKRRQAIANKADALFKIAINTAENIVKVFPNPYLMAFAGLLGALEAAAVIAKPIPKYAKGIENAPEGLAIVGEKGREIIESEGRVSVVEKPSLTYLKKGSRVIPNPKTEQIFNMSGKDDYIIKEAIDNQTRQMVDAIKTKKELHINMRNGTIAEREGDYFKTYYNKKILM